MCGIAGFIRRDAGDVPHQTPHQTMDGDRALVRAMCDRIRHRGPDDEGLYAGAGGTIGMRRLAIIDLLTGHQPMCNEDATLWTVFNGEIYNYQSLREDLIARGHRFQTNSDS